MNCPVNLTFAWFLLLGASRISAGDASIRQAYELELAGNNTQRQAVISELSQDSTPSAQVHWLNGEVRVGEEWLPYRRVVDHGDRWAELHRYREERAKRGASVEDQFFLADGCQHHKLFDEERAHLFGVLDTDTQNAEARERLGDRLIQNVWVTSEEAKAAQRALVANRAAFQTWAKTLEPTVKNLSDRSEKRRSSGQEALTEIHDPSAIPVLEYWLTRGNETLQLDYLNWVRGVDSWKASASIARLAVTSDSPRVRVEAVRELKNRPMEDFVPTIIGSMVTPVELRTHTQQFGDWVLYSQHSVSETQNQQFNYHYIARFSPEYVIFLTGALNKPLVRTNPLLISAQDGQRILAVLNSQQLERATESNASVTRWNDRCHRGLTEVTGIADMKRPQDWWAWWQDDQGYVLSGKDQVFAQYQEEWFAGRVRAPARPRGTVSPFMPFLGIGVQRSGSCFVAGTPVMTEYGSKTIESIVRGDRVLSQDIETGELAFKPVLRTPKRLSPSSAVVKFGGEQLTCTPGHPFWVNGKGWRMARELEPGDRFHSVTGSVDVSGVDAADKVEVFNLEVGDFHTYFVGQNPVLTHDVTVRQPTDKLLPGYEAPLTAAK